MKLKLYVQGIDDFDFTFTCQSHLHYIRQSSQLDWSENHVLLASSQSSLVQSHLSVCIERDNGILGFFGKRSRRCLFFYQFARAHVQFDHCLYKFCSNEQNLLRLVACHRQGSAREPLESFFVSLQSIWCNKLLLLAKFKLRNHFDLYSDPWLKVAGYSTFVGLSISMSRIGPIMPEITCKI